MQFFIACLVLISGWVCFPACGKNSWEDLPAEDSLQPFDPYKKVFIHAGGGLIALLLASKSPDQLTTIITPTILSASGEYGITRHWSLGITLERLGYGPYEDSITVDTRAYQFLVHS